MVRMFWESFGLLAESVASVTSHKPCRQRKGKGVQDGDVDVHDVVTRGLAGSPRVPLRFQLALRAPDGPVLGPDQAVLRRLTLGGRTVPTPFFAAQRVTRDRVTPREVSGHVTGRLSVPNQSSFGELRMGPTLRDTLDTGLCCSSQGRGHVQSFENYSNVEVMPTTAIYNLPHRTGTVLTPGSYLQCCSGSLSSSDTSLMGKGWVSNAFDGWTNVFPDAWWAPQGPMHIFSDVHAGAWPPSNQPRRLGTPAATSYLRFIMDAQRPRLHFVQLNPARPADASRGRGVTKDWLERIEVSLPSPMFCRGSRELHMGRELGDAGPATVGFYF